MALRSFREGDRVKMVVLSVDIDKRRLSLSLKPSYFCETDFQAGGDDSKSGESDPELLGVVTDEDEDVGEDEEMGEDEDEDEADIGEDHGDESRSDYEDDVDADMDEDDIILTDIQADLFKSGTSQALKTKSKTPAQTLDLGSSFQWNVGNTQDEDVSMASDSDLDDDVQPSQPKKRKRKRD